MTKLDPRRQALLEEKLGRLLDWHPPEFVSEVGPNDPTPVNDYRRNIDMVTGQCSARLEAYPDEVIELLSETAPTNDNPHVVEWREFAAKSIDTLNRFPPQWFACGLGHPDYRADYAYWAKMPHYTVSEATCLSVGVEPRHYPHARLENSQIRTQMSCSPR